MAVVIVLVVRLLEKSFDMNGGKPEETDVFDRDEEEASGGEGGGYNVEEGAYKQ